MRSYSIIATVTLAALATVACSEDEEIPSVAESNNIIFVTPNTGEFAAKGAEFSKAIQLAFDRIKSAGATTKPLLLHVVDAGDNADTCKPRLEAKLNELGVASIGGIITAGTAAQACAIPYVLDPTSPLQVKVPVIETLSGSDLIELGPKDNGVSRRLDTKWAFSTRPLCGPEPRFSADYVVDRFAKDPVTFGRVAILRGPDAHDKGHAADFRKHITAKNFAGQLLGDANGAPIEMDKKGPFEPYIQQAMAQNASAIYYHLNGDVTNLNFLAAAKRVGFTGAILTCGMARSTKLLDPVQSQNTTSYLAGVDPPIAGGRLHFMMRGLVKNDRLSKFQEEFRTFTKQQNVDTFTPPTYDAAMMLGLALAASNGVPERSREILAGMGTGGKKIDYADAFGALTALKNGEDVDYDGASGDLDFTHDEANGAIVGGRYYGEVIKAAGSTFVYEVPADAPDLNLTAEPLNPPAKTP